MRLLAIVHLYTPLHNAGAELMLHAILTDFIGRGDEATVVFPDLRTPYSYDGVLVGGVPRDLAGLAREHDVVVTHLDRTVAAVHAARAADRPIVHLLHNDRQLQFHRVQPGPDVLLVSNSEWIDATVPNGYARIICRPPVDPAKYDTDGPHDLITLVNLTSPKGTATFYGLAGMMLTRRFLGVMGAYGVQDIRTARRLRNVEIIPNTPLIRDRVYARTRVLLMPSSYESWGRVAIEAASSGIPVIAHPTHGLVEALGDAGIFHDRRDTRAWARTIQRLDDPDEYATASAQVRARAHHLADVARDDLAALHARITAHVGDHVARRGAAYHRPPSMSPILNSIRAGIRCAVCGAGACACSTDPEGIVRGLRITIAPPLVGNPDRPNTFRTWRGDYRFTVPAAIRAGLLPDPESSELPRDIIRRLRGLGDETVADLRAAYTAATLDGRAQFLQELAITPPSGVYERMVPLLGALTAAQGRAAPTVPDGPDGATQLATMRVGDVLEWAGDDRERIRLAVDAETGPGGRNRTTLLNELRRRAGVNA